MSMRHRSSLRASVLTIVLGVPLVLASIAFSEEEEMVPVSIGVFSEEQAELGAEAFAQHCARCHGASLGGGMGPRLVPLDPGVYRGEPLAKPFAFMRTQMPLDAPGSLEDETYLQILTFILRENGYPTGDEPLSAEDDALAQYLLDDPPAE